MIARLLLFALVSVSLFGETPLDTVQPLAAEWARLRSETIRLETQWRTDRQFIEASRTVLQERIERLRKRLDALQASHSEEEKSFNDLKSRRDAALESLKSATPAIAELTRSFQSFEQNLPPRLHQAIAQPLRSLQNETLGAPEKMQFLVSLAGRSLEFNRLITYSEEAISVPNASGERVMQVLYWGLSHAYALDQGTNTAYLGHPSATGWTWEPLPGAAPNVSRMIAIYRETSDPAFVAAPAMLANPVPSTL